MDGLISIAGVTLILLAAGLLLGALDRANFHPRWLFVAAGLVALNDALLTNVYGLIPDVFHGLEWNWQGKLIALLATLGIAKASWFGYARCGLVLRQASGCLKPALIPSGLYVVFFLVLALAFPGDAAPGETVAFQLTMPGLEEELFYRGLLLAVLDRAFASRVKFLGIRWGWGSLVSCALFGLAHAFSYSGQGFGFDPMVMALTAVPALLAVWLRYRTGSVLIPVLLHNLGNSMSFLV